MITAREGFSQRTYQLHPTAGKGQQLTYGASLLAAGYYGMIPLAVDAGLLLGEVVAPEYLSPITAINNLRGVTEDDFQVRIGPARMTFRRSELTANSYSWGMYKNGERLYWIDR